MTCMSTSMSFTVVLTDVEGGWTQAQLRELPGVITCAPTPEQARDAVVEALRDYLESFTSPAPEASEPETTGLLRLTIDAA